MYNSKLKKEEPINYSSFGGMNDGHNGSNHSSGDGFFAHPSKEEVMRFVTATKEDITKNSEETIKMVKHFCVCEDCRIVKNEMMQMNAELNLALKITMER